MYGRRRSMGGIRARTYLGKRRPNSYSKRTGEYGGYQRGATGTFSSRPNTMIPFRQKGLEIKSCDKVTWSADCAGALATDNLKPSTVGVFDVCNALTSASGPNQRIGRRVEGLGIRIKAFAYPNAAYTGVDFDPVVWRTILIYDAAPSGAITGKDNILEDLQAAANTYDYLSGQNRNYMNRFTFLMDKIIVLPALQTAAGALSGYRQGVAPETFAFDEYRMLKGLATTYTNSNANPTIGDIATGAIYVFVIGNYTYADAANSPYLLKITTRYTYKDA